MSLYDTGLDRASRKFNALLELNPSLGVVTIVYNNLIAALADASFREANFDGQWARTYLQEAESIETNYLAYKALKEIQADIRDTFK